MVDLVESSDVVLETRVLVSRRLKDKNESLGLSPEDLVLVLVSPVTYLHLAKFGCSYVILHWRVLGSTKNLGTLPKVVGPCSTVKTCLIPFTSHSRLNEKKTLREDANTARCLK